jgi:predicted nucleotidyltransferase component of viral defense system
VIPEAFVTAWSVDHPWPQPAQVEQDLLLSRALCAIADDPYLGDELVFRGGTALFKLHLDRPRRYSEDLDYVRRTDGGIGKLTRALTDLGVELGFRVSTKMGEYPKVLWRATAADGSPLRIKIEVNTRERVPVHEPIHVRHDVDSRWWSGGAYILTSTPRELVATKIRALYQRSKGRDLFDLWLAFSELGLDPAEVMDVFALYRPRNLSPAVAERNLRAKVRDASFRQDLEPLIQAPVDGYDMHEAVELIVRKLFVLL